MRRPYLSVAVVVLFSAISFGQAPKPDSPEIDRKVDAILSRMTLEQKVDMLGGINIFDVRGFPELGLPPLHTADGPVGVRNDGPATTMAGGISLASTWDTVLAQHLGEQIGRDARAKGKHFMLGPGVNIYRSPLNGRNFEYFGEDPFLGSRIAVGYIKGMQSQGVGATVKHFLGNNSEYDRHNSNSIIDERTMREIYLPIFEAAVREGHVASVMDSYNFVNGEHMTQNSAINNGILKKEWGFEGVLMSDWDATYDAVGAANGGLDLEMPSGKFMNREKLLPAIQAGQVSEATINDKIRRILRTEIEYGWMDREQRDLSVPRYNQEGRKVALQAAREGIVLLKNQGNVLPLSKEKTKTIALIGPNVYPADTVGGGSAQVSPFHAVSMLEGFGDHFAGKAQVMSAAGIMSFSRAASNTNFQTEETNGQPGMKYEHFKDNETFAGSPDVAEVRKHVVSGELLDVTTFSTEDFDFSDIPPAQIGSERWTGYYIAKAAGSFDIFVQQGGFADTGFRMYLDDKLIFDNWDIEKFIVAQTSVNLDARTHKVVVEHHSGQGFGKAFIRMGIVPEHEWVDSNAEAMAAKADAVVVVVGYRPDSEAEGWDRTFQLPPGQNELIKRIAAKNKNTVVVVISGGGVDMQSWLDQVPAVLEAWYPGQEGGTAVAEIVSGDVNPSGHLPATFEKRWEDNPSYNSYYPEQGTKTKVVYKEGVFVGYRGYEHNAVKPLFPFGYGLSYTTFKYANLKADEHGVSFEVTNTGSRAGAAVPQIYVAPEHASVPRPAKELKGFSRVTLKPGETQTVKVPLNTRSFAYYDVQGKHWRAEKGTYTVELGTSSEQIELKTKVTLAADATE
jgi:beta-glucosidase